MEEQILALAMQALSAEEKNLIQMRFFENMTQTEIAGRLGMTQVQVSRGKRRSYRKCGSLYFFNKKFADCLLEYSSLNT